MTSHVARLYGVAASILALFLAWAGVAASPWQAEKAPTATRSDQTAAALARYEQRLRRDARLVRRIVAREAQQPAPTAPVVRIVSAPPVATTRTS